jgi:hypothetical protein
MKRTISIVLSLLIVLSLVLSVNASGNAGQGKGANTDTSQVTSTTAPAVTPAPSVTTGSALTLEGLNSQLKANHKDKVLRKAILKQIVLLRHGNGDKTIPVIVNGILVKFDVPPVIKQSRMLIPVRAVTNALGAVVAWDPKTPDIVTITKKVSETQTIVIIINLKTGIVTKDGIEIKLDVPAQVISNRTMVPIRFLAEAFGMKVESDKDTGGVFVDNDGKVVVDGESTSAPTPAPTDTTIPTPTTTP